jgi:REP element-mobilizing transposase RayT
MDGYKIRDESKPHFVTFTVVDWIDVFSRSTYKDIIIESLSFCQQNKGLILCGYVIMSNHLHLIMQSSDGKLSSLIRDIKAFSAKKILSTIKEGPKSRSEWMLKRFEFAAMSNSRNEGMQFWKYGNHPEEIYSEKFFWSKLNYIHMNPVRAKLVAKASHYLYSSASNYVDYEGLINVEKLNNPIIDKTKNDWTKDIDNW